MKVCITEKPSVARDIAKILGADKKQDGYFENDEYRVTWTFGHLCTLKEPADYTERWKRWTLGALPMLPDKFGIKLIPDRGIEQEFGVIKKLVNEAEEVINCGDAGQEGELIQRWVMQKAGVKCPVQRLWISSLTDESIKEGFKNLKPQIDFNNLYYAGLSRAIGDWILGINATRLYSLKYSSPGNVLSVGRVQTPTLAMIVARHKEIEAFKSADFWELKTLYRDVVFNSTAGRYNSEDDVQAIVDRINGLPLIVKDVIKKNGRESAPRLFDLTSLQVECNKRWGWTAEEALQRIQSLYEKKVTTYPRVDTTYLSLDMYPKIPVIMQRMTPYANITAPLLQAPVVQSNRIFDNAKVTDHHAIIPTGESPSVLVGKKKLYHLIALRFIAAFYPDSLFETTTVMATVDDVEFRVIGKVITFNGWRDILQPVQGDASPAKGAEANKDDESKLMPPFTVGESGPHIPSWVKKSTQPPKYYTEATLLRAMESAGRSVDDETLREAMKENGIGRPSTRAAIIETLFKRRYIYRKKKNIMASTAGIALIDTINEELLKSPKLTGIWENRLRLIERGDYSAAEFLEELKKQINTIVINVLSDNSMTHIDTGAEETVPFKGKEAAGQKVDITSYEMISCPKCKKGHIVKGRSAFGCSNFKECDFRLMFNEYAESLTPKQLATKIGKLFKK